MTTRARAMRVTLMLLLGGWAVAAGAQEGEPKRSYSSLLNVDAMIDNYARLLARKYDLTEEQDAFTQQYLRDRCHAFLARNREQLFDLVDRMMEVRNGGEISPQEMMQWGQRALPLYEQAKALIIESNNEWRGILTDEQRKIHDADLATMYEGFGSTEDQLRRLVSGEMTVDEFRRGQPGRPNRPGKPDMGTPAGAPPTPAPAAPASPKPTTPPASPAPAPAAPAPPPAGTPKVPAAPGATPPKEGAAAGGASDAEKAHEEAMERLKKIREKNEGGGGKSSGAPTPNPAPPPAAGRAAPAGKAGPVAQKAGADFESQWEAYVREFIQKYRLTEEQSERAYSILRDCQEQGRNYMAKHKAEIEDLDKRLAEVNAAQQHDKSKDKSQKESKEINDRKAKVFEPIANIFEKQLKPRLDKLLTRAQRQAAEAGKSQPGKGKPGVPAGKPGEQTPTPPPTPPPQETPPQDPPPEPPPQPGTPGQDK